MQQEIYCYEEGLHSRYYLVLFGDQQGREHIPITRDIYRRLYLMGVKENPDWIPEQFLKGQE